MNQILYNESLEISNKIIDKNNSKSALRKSINSQSNYFNQNISSMKWYKIIFFVSLFLLIFFIILFLARIHENWRNEEISKKLTTSYSISTMYSNAVTSDYTIFQNSNTPFVIRNN